LVAGIGYLPYDHRFAQLDYRARRTVEVVRLFVVPEYRRHGLARRCLRRCAAAQRAGVEWLYLHTHPFLPGAIRFWEGQGLPLWMWKRIRFGGLRIGWCEGWGLA
jgi:GNAT superfamily N-acetyltransferase